MAWQSLEITAGEDVAETVSDALMELGALSVSIEDADAQTDNEVNYLEDDDSQDTGVDHRKQYALDLGDDLTNDCYAFGR